MESWSTSAEKLNELPKHMSVVNTSGSNTPTATPTLSYQRTSSYANQGLTAYSKGMESSKLDTSYMLEEESSDTSLTHSMMEIMNQ